MSSTGRRDERVAAVSVPVPPIPMHWINTVPVKSEDRPCVISSLELEVHVSGLYADVAETLVISNPNKRDLSVDISIPMPDRAAVHGYSLDIDGQMIDGVVVPKDKARVAFETEQRIGADPGLVEAVKGNIYRTRVYPVPANKTRTVQLRYIAPLLVVDGRAVFLDAPMPSERLGERKVRIDVELLDCPVPELSGINGVRFEEVGTCWRVESNEKDVEPESGIRVALPKLPESFAIVERDAEGTLWFAASEAVPLSNEDAPAITSLTVLWDVSGSRAALDHEAELELLRGYCDSKSIKKYRLIAFGDRVHDALDFDSGEGLLERIGQLLYDGGSDFQALSRALVEEPDTDGAYVLFTDGMDTLSGEPVSFPQGMKVLAAVSGTDRDFESLRQACAGLAFDLAAAPKGTDGLARALFCSNLLSGIEGAGVADVLGIGSGADGRYSVVGKLASQSTSITFANTNTEFALDAANARERSTISLAWASTRVGQLSPRADENADELLGLGRRFGVVSPVTSLLVLETLEQWLRYDIEPPATWEKMYREWERHRQGMMKVSSEAGLAADHLRNLKREWADLLEWHKRDYPTQGPDWEQADERGYIGAGLHEWRAAGSPSATYGANSITVAACDASCAPEGDWMVRECEMLAPTRALYADRCMSDGAALPDDGDMPAGASVKVQAWMPDADYLKALDEALPNGSDSVREAYFQQRCQHASSPSFFIDCAGWFMANGDKAFGLQVLTNLAELRIEDAALLRVMAWRLRESGELERSLSVLRRVLKLRPEDSQSHRDVALVLDELAREAYGAGDEGAARELSEEAGSFYRETALTPWERRPMAIGLFAVEEYNVLRAWADAQSWEAAPQLESLGEELEGVLDCDLRITLAWDADETDIDIHVTEPSGEEAYYGNRLTHSGGRVSEDITDGYGPELYEIRKAEDGVYDIRAHYYASHQQTVFGPASCTLTVFTDWGRPNQSQQVTSMRLEDEHEMVPVGTAAYGNAANHDESASESDEEGQKPQIVKGSSAADLIAVYGLPTEGDPCLSDGQMVWALSSGRMRTATIVAGKAERVIERMPWGEEMVVVQ